MPEFPGVNVSPQEHLRRLLASALAEQESESLPNPGGYVGPDRRAPEVAPYPAQLQGVGELPFTPAALEPGFRGRTSVGGFAPEVPLKSSAGGAGGVLRTILEQAIKNFPSISIQPRRGASGLEVAGAVLPAALARGAASAFVGDPSRPSFDVGERARAAERNKRNLEVSGIYAKSRQENAAARREARLLSRLEKAEARKAAVEISPAERAYQSQMGEFRARTEMGLPLERPNTFGMPEPPKPPSAIERERLAEDAAVLAQVADIRKQYRPEYVGPIAGRVGSLGQKTGDISPGASRFRSDLARWRNKAINVLSGANVPPAEYERIKQGLPLENDPPVVFEAKLASSIVEIERVARTRRETMVQTGVDLSRLAPLPSMTTDPAKTGAVKWTRDARGRPVPAGRP